MCTRHYPYAYESIPQTKELQTTVNVEISPKTQLAEHPDIALNRPTLEGEQRNRLACLDLVWIGHTVRMVCSGLFHFDPGIYLRRIALGILYEKRWF